MIPSHRILRCVLPALAGALVLARAAAARIDAADGTSFLREFGRSALAAGALADAAEREARLRVLYRGAFDAEAIAARVAGRAWRTAPPARRAAFAEGLERYIAKSIDARLARLGAAEFEVLMSEPEAEGLVVYSRVVQRGRGRSFNIQWRLVKDGAGFRIRDIAVEGISVTLHLRRLLAERVRTQDGTLDPLTAALAALVTDGE